MKKHLYYPDFEIENRLIEIKGDMMIDENGKVIPHPTLIKKAKKENPDLLESQISAKNKCMKEWDVEIWSSEKIKFYLDYVKEKYGLNYFKSCRTEA